jgi:hypothetical protein
VNSPQDFGTHAQGCVASLLRSKGFDVELRDYASPFDLLVNGRRVEVKAARPTSWSTKNGRHSYTLWRLNLHRHGRLTENEVDFYVFRLEDVPEFRNAVHLVVPSPAKSKTVSLTLRSLIGGKWAKHINRFDRLAKAR